MKTAEEIIAYLEAELNEAIDLHDEAKEKKDMAHTRQSVKGIYHQRIA